MALYNPQSQNLLDLQSAVTSLPQYGAIDDFAAMAVLATLSLFYYFVVRDRPDPFLYKMYERPQEKLGLGKLSEETRDIAKKLEETVSTF